jgi:transcriptional regulator with XRE-family HTH domain
MATVFFQRVEALCLREGISTTKLSSETGISEAAISGWRKGATPRNNTIAQLADYFGVSPAYIAGKSDDPVDYVSVDTSGFNQGIWQKILRDYNYNETPAIKAYLEFEQAQAQDALSDPIRVEIYQNNDGTVGVQGHAPVTINGKNRSLSEQEHEILRIFTELNLIEQSKVLVYAADLRDKKGGT